MSNFNIENKFTPREFVPLVKQVTDFLTNAIMHGHLKMGERLVESTLEKHLGISRAPIRESFRVLERNGLITNIPRRGTFVREITKKDIEEVFPIRAWLESLAARMAIPHLEPRDIKEMRSALSLMKESITKKNIVSYLEHHSNFHEIFIHKCKNERLIEILATLRHQSLWYRFSYLYFQMASEESIRVHRHILDLFIKKNFDQLEVVIKDHIQAALKSFLMFLETNK